MGDNYYYPPGFDASVLEGGLVEEAVERKIEELREDSVKFARVIEAADQYEPLFFGVPYDIAHALYRLHETDVDCLIGSDVLADLYREAKRVHAAIESALDRAAREELGV